MCFLNLKSNFSLKASRIQQMEKSSLSLVPKPHPSLGPIVWIINSWRQHRILSAQKQESSRKPSGFLYPTKIPNWYYASFILLQIHHSWVKMVWKYTFKPPRWIIPLLVSLLSCALHTWKKMCLIFLLLVFIYFFWGGWDRVGGCFVETESCVSQIGLDLDM